MIRRRGRGREREGRQAVNKQREKDEGKLPKEIYGRERKGRGGCQGELF